MQSILQTLQEEFHSALTLSKKSTPRSYRFPEAKNIIKVAIGMRRSGKTYFLFQTIRQLLSEKIALEHILYLNFEDDRILPMDHKTMGQLIDTWYTLYPENHNHCCYLRVGSDSEKSRSIHGRIPHFVGLDDRCLLRH